LQILVINRVRVLGSGLHTPTQFFWEYLPRVQINTNPIISNTWKPVFQFHA